MSKKYVVSDLHANDPRFDHEAFELFRKEIVKDDSIIFVGDIFDQYVARSADTPPIRKDKDIYIRGNHDRGIENLGFDLVDNYEQNGIFFIHGNQFDEKKNYGWHLRWLLLFVILFYKLTGIDLQSRLRLWNIKLGKLFNKNEFFSYISIIHDRARVCKNEKNYKFLIMGHTHQCMMDDDICDLGCWYKNKERTYYYATVDENDIALCSLTYVEDDSI